MADELLKAGRVPGVDAQAGGHPIVPPVNEGSFLAVALDAARTLVTYQVSTDIGGDVPERAVADFARLRLKKALRTLMAHAPGAARHYDAHHAPILGGGGVLRPTGGLAGAAR